MGGFKEDETNNKISVVFSIGNKIRFLKAMEEYNYTATELVLHLLNNYYGDNLETLKRFRYNLENRAKKGINYQYVAELKKLKQVIDLQLKNLS